MPTRVYLIQRLYDRYCPLVAIKKSVGLNSSVLALMFRS